MGPGGHAVCYYLRGGALLNFVGIIETELACRRILDAEIPMGIAQEGLRRLASRDPDHHRRRRPATNAIAGRCIIAHRCATGARSAPRFSAIPRMRPCPISRKALRWRSRTARCWRARSRQESDIAEGLDLYQRNRVDRTSRIVEQSTQNRRLFHLPSKEAIRAEFSKRNEGEEPQSLALFLQSADGRTDMTVARQSRADPIQAAAGGGRLRRRRGRCDRRRNRPTPTARGGLGFSYVIGGNGGVAFKAAQEQVARFVDGQVLPPPPALWRKINASFNRTGHGPEPDRARRHRCRGLGSARATGSSCRSASRWAANCAPFRSMAAAASTRCSRPKAAAGSRPNRPRAD